MQVNEGRTRVIIQGVTPEIEAGRFPIKRIAGDETVVEADILTDGHDELSCALLFRREADLAWSEVPMLSLGNDRWRAKFRVQDLGRYRYTVQGWVDHFKTWRRDLERRVEAEQDMSVDLRIGAELVKEVRQRATKVDASWLSTYANALQTGGEEGTRHALSPELDRLMSLYADRRFATIYDRELEIVVDRERARFGAWYELFPRSCSSVPGRHGTFKDVEGWLPYVASMGFDVLYLPPIHPIGMSFRKGRNNSIDVGKDDPGSPWAIGSIEGGHKSVHPDLGTLADFRHLIETAVGFGIELAIDIAFQCAPDNPYVTEHPVWFRRRPDGTIQYAENPPKKYQDIYPFDFETEHWKELWAELKDVVSFWADQGVRIFRVDNPHTKPFSFWEWLITEIKREYPEAIFLAEAFTRPKALYGLAKRGFTQSYNYFPWRNTKWELTEYLTELTQTEVSEFTGLNLWPNTPDILPEYLQFGGRPAFMTRLILAATLSPSYGIYGPAFELCENRPLATGREEYLDSEKYEIKNWDLDKTDSIMELISQVNRIRRENPAFQVNHDLRFHEIDNEQIIAYSKSSVDRSNQVLVVVNLDPHHIQSGFLTLPLEEMGIDAHQPYQAHDLLTDARYLWHGTRNYVELNPQAVTAHIFVIRRKVSTEHDFDYYL
ncbi:MAG: alpha-1,4-glucan--maltose-1-phosphate maltosyltransferase [Chloroflexi bacterium RBG_16_54_18]|nr:MAG: alpha-1,4-glucan--maltose-1-phosphate maltosyltransferase [Chloroflexi bacterium RBG_16_54_18]